MFSQDAFNEKPVIRVVGVGGGGGGRGRGRGHGRARRTVRLVAQNVMPTEKCRRSFFKASAQARSMRSGPIGLRQRRPAP